MEDNNNNDEKTIIDKGKKLVEKEGKKVAARAIKQIMPALLPVIGFVALIFLIVGLINAIPIIIQTIFASILNMFFPSSPDSALATSGSTSATESVIYIDDNGAYKLKAKDIADQLLEALEKQKVNTEVLGLKQEANESADGGSIDKNMIEKYIEAEIQTTYPKTGCSGNDVDGTIIIKRATKDGTIKNLTYTSYKNFCSNVSSGNSGVLSQFSLNPNTLDLCIAREVSSTQYIGADGKVLRTDVSENSEYSGNGYVKEEINYQKYVQNYSAPLNFFISLHLISQDVDFMQELYYMVIGTGKDEPLVLTYVDSYYQSTTEYQYSGYETTYFNEYTGTDEPIAEDINSIQLTAMKANVEPNQPIDNSNVEGYIGSVEYYKKIDTSYSGRLYVSNADTWLKSFGKDITKTSSPDPEGPRKDEPIKDEYKNTIYYKVKDISNGEYSYWTRGGYISITRTEILTNTSTSFTVVDKESKINIDKFIELIRSYPKVENNFKTSPSNIFLMLQQTENTQRLEKIMRYVMFVLNDVDYGVKEEALQYLLADKTNSISTSSLLKNYIRHWENASTPPTNADGTCYIIEDDGADHPTVGYGVDIENCGYKQLFIENGYPTEIGGEVPIEFVDSIEERVINEKAASVKALTEGLDLTGYQMNALISRAYNCGADGAITIKRGTLSFDFVESYQLYWNQEEDSKFEEKDNLADYSHELYVEYMSKPVTSNGEFLKGLENRRMSEWTLFQTGYYDVLNVWHPDCGDILQAADLVHQQEINWTYSVGGDLYWNDIEKSLNNPNQVTCCAAYVACVIYKAGLFNEEEMNSFENYNYCPTLYNDLESAGWQVINSYDELEPGDIVFMNYNNGGGLYDHVQIYAGDGTWYNAGNTEAIQRSSPYSQGSWARSNFYVALRAN